MRSKWKRSTNRGENNSIAEAITQLPILVGSRMTILETFSSNGNRLPHGIMYQTTCA